MTKRVTSRESSRPRLPIANYGRAELLALLLVGSVAAGAIAGVTPDSPVAPRTSRVASSALACPLTVEQEHKAVQAFEKMMPVVTHPRCFNCHGGVNPFTADGGHLGGEMDRPGTANECASCHVDVPNLRTGRGNRWQLPVDDMFFVGKTERELCNQFQRFSGGPDFFVGHMINENRGTQFTEVAYRGDRGLNRFGREIYTEATGRQMEPEPPPIPHSDLVAHAREWANAVGAPGWRIEDCGCRVRLPAWEGTVSTSWTQREPGFGTLTETMNATVRFELDSTFLVPGEPAVHWKTTSGVLKWTITATGGTCTTSAAGTVPVRLGADGNPWGTLRLEPDSTGAMGYSVDIGPWPDEYVPRYVYKCREEPKILPGIPYGMHSWWHHPEGTRVSPDGKAIKGTFVAPHPLGETRWTWDFKLVRN